MYNKITADLKTGNKLQDKVNIVRFHINLFLLIGHILLLFLYIAAKTKLMTIIDIIGIIIYIYYYKRCVKKPILFSKTAFAEIWIHMILAVITFGWGPGFQNWTYGLVGAFFLPTVYSDKSNKTPKRPYIAGLNFIFIYYILAIVLNLYDFPIRHELNSFHNHLLFAINTLTTFISIFAFTFFYTSSHKIKEDNLTQIAEYDELTNLRNRYALNTILKNINDDTNNYSVAIMDVDFFKKVNDTYGHNVGDIVLRNIANKIRKMEKQGIIGGRWGGEEFLIIGPNDMTKEYFISVLEEFRKYVESSKIRTIHHLINITVSIGISEKNNDININEAIEIADENLYKAKESGRNRIIY